MIEGGPFVLLLLVLTLLLCCLIGLKQIFLLTLRAISVGNLLSHHPCLMSNFLQDALRGLDDEELERFNRWLNMVRELRIVNLWKQAEKSHEQGSSARQCLHACRYCSRPCIFQNFSASHSEMHDRTDWHRCHLHWYREGCMVMTLVVMLTVTPYGVLCVCHPLIAKRTQLHFSFLLLPLFFLSIAGGQELTCLSCPTKLWQVSGCT